MSSGNEGKGAALAVEAEEIGNRASGTSKIVWFGDFYELFCCVSGEHILTC